MNLGGDPPEYFGAIEYRKHEMRRLQFPFGLVGFLFLLGLAGLVTVASAGTEKYDYDPLGRLIRFINPQGLITRYTYDGVGNILGYKVACSPNLQLSVRYRRPKYDGVGASRSR